MLNVDGLRQHITSPLADEALQLLLDAAYEAIDRHSGTGASELLRVGSGPLLMLSREPAAITSVSERGITLAANDYQVVGQTLLRLRDGTHGASRWRGDFVEVIYSPVSDTATRDSIAVQLVNLRITYKPGLVSQSIGSWSEAYGQGDAAYERAEAAILASLDSPFVMF